MLTSNFYTNILSLTSQNYMELSNNLPSTATENSYLNNLYLQDISSNSLSNSQMSVNLHLPSQDMTNWSSPTLRSGELLNPINTIFLHSTPENSLSSDVSINELSSTLHSEESINNNSLVLFYQSPSNTLKEGTVEKIKKSSKKNLENKIQKKNISTNSSELPLDAKGIWDSSTLRFKESQNNFFNFTLGKNSVKNVNKYTDYTFNDFIENKIDLYSYNLPVLKKIAKELKINTTAKKQIIINRIIEHYNKVKTCILIQRIFRGFLVRLSFRLRGPAFKNRNLCVNDKDGFTLEPINEIPFERFYSFCDKKNFVYGFDIILLYISYKKTNKMINPFSREQISPNETNNILRLENKIKLLFSYTYENNEIYEIQKYDILPSQPNRRITPPRYSNINIFSPSQYSHSTENSFLPSLQNNEPTDLPSQSTANYTTLRSGGSLNHIRFNDDDFHFTETDRWTLLPIQRREGVSVGYNTNQSIWNSSTQSRENQENSILPRHTSENSPSFPVLQETGNVTNLHSINTENWGFPTLRSQTNLEQTPNNNEVQSYFSNLTRNTTANTLRRLEEPSPATSILGFSTLRSDESINNLNRNENSSQSYLVTNQKYLLTKKMQEIRSYPIQTRIENLFIEIDLLGNYTSSSWFNEIIDYSVFFMSLYTIWNYRVVINNNEKKKISQLYDPFMTHTIYNTRNMLNNEIKEICVTVMENLVHCGIDEEYRKLGTYRVLMALTLVNSQARNTYNWLYDSIL